MNNNYVTIEGAQFKELKQLIPGSNRRRVQVLLRSLQKDELIYSNGKGGAAKWFPAKWLQLMLQHKDGI